MVVRYIDEVRLSDYCKALIGDRKGILPAENGPKILLG